MSSKAVLKSSFIGYIYRGMRIVGCILTIAGTWQLGDILYHSFAGVQAVATVTRLQSVCVLQGVGSMAQVVKSEIECSEADATKAKYPSVPFTVGEVIYGHFQFLADDGSHYEVRAPLAALEANGAEHGSTVTIVYNRSNPAIIRPSLPVAALLQALSFLTGGAAILFAVLTVRWVANHRRGIEVDVAKLQEVHNTNIRKSLRLPLPMPAKPAPKVRVGVTRSSKPS